MDLLISVLDKKSLERHLQEFRAILSQEPHEYWTGEHFLTPLPMKFELSVAAFSGETLAGYIIASLKEEGPYIHKFMVRGDLRGLSIGSRMLDFFEKNILEKGFNSIDLAVREENQRGIEFYSEKNFSLKGRRTDTKDNSVLLLMRKEVILQEHS